MDSYYAVCSSIYEFKARLDRIDYLFSFYGIYICCNDEMFLDLRAPPHGGCPIVMTLSVRLSILQYFLWQIYAVINYLIL